MSDENQEHKGRRFALAGHEKGRTVNKGGFQFVDGVYTHEGSHNPTMALVTYLERSYYAFPEGSAAFDEAQARYEREQKTGKTETPSDQVAGEQSAAAEQPSDEVKQAVHALDHENDEHWDGNGKPKLAAVADLAGETVTRQAVELVAPGYNRAAAKAAAAI